MLVKVETLQEVRHNGIDVPAGNVVEIEDSLLAAWIRAGLAKPSTSNVSDLGPSGAGQTVTAESGSEAAFNIIDLEAFSELKAEAQNDLLQKLEIEGDTSNKEKRVALYEAYLQKASAAGGAETGGAEAEVTGNQDGGGNNDSLGAETGAGAGSGAGDAAGN